MDGFSVETHLDVDDWRAYQQACQRRLGADRHPLRTFFLVLALSLLLGFLGAALARVVGQPLHVWQIVTGMAIAWVGAAVRLRMVRRSALPAREGIFLGATRYAFSSEGILQDRKQSRTTLTWPALRGIEMTSRHLLLWVDRVAAYVVPLRDLPPDISAEQAVAQIQALAAQAGVPAIDMNQPAAPAPLTESDPRTTSLWRSLGDALRVVFYGPLRHGVAVHQGATVLLGVLALILWVGLDGWAQDEPVRYSASGVAGIAWYVLAALIVAWVTAIRSHPALPLRNSVWLMAVLAPLAIVGTWLASFKDPPWSQAILAVTTLLAALCALRALRAMTGRQQVRSISGALASSVLLWMLTNALLINATVWYPFDAEDSDASVVDSEQLLFEQPARIDAAVARIPAHAGDGAAASSMPQAYLLGFAGVGEQRVFAEEIKLAAQVLGQRYGSTQRSLLMINDARDQDTQPLATVTGLERALHGIGQRMDRERDILFLVLSSHGSQDATIAVSNGSMALDQLDADSLADLLQESGIRFKVIIISACYAGGFIPALQDEDTIILTAAAADRTSFGCSSDRDLTYFGEALFRDALPGATSLQSAFSTAAAAIAKREIAERETPSKPQAYFGAAIMARLAELERARQTRPTLSARAVR